MLKSTIARLALMLALPAAVLSASSTASANVRTTKHGSSCQFGSYYKGLPPDGDNSITTIAYHDVNGTFMWSTAKDNFVSSAVCSLDRALPLSTAGFSDIEVRLQPYWNTVPHTTSCTVWSLRPDGSFVDGEQRSIVVPQYPPGGAYAMLLDFGNSIGATVSKGAVVIDCGLFDGVVLNSFYFSENDGVSGN